MPRTQTLTLGMCKCGNLHLSYRSVSLHFRKEEFLLFAEHVHRMATQIARLPQHQHSTGLSNKNEQTFH